MTQPSSKRRERRARFYTLLAIEAKMLGGKNIRTPSQPNSNAIKNLREYIEILRSRL